MREQKAKEANLAANTTLSIPSLQTPPFLSLPTPSSVGSPNDVPALLHDSHFNTILTDDPSLFIPSIPAHAAYISPSSSSESDQRLIPHDWPPRLPPPDLLHHLIDIFFACHPHALYLVHRPTFMASLTFSPKSPAFPHLSLLHAICAYASIFSYRVQTPPANIEGDLFPKRNAPARKALDDSFAERHVRWSRQARDDATSVGNNLIECTQCKYTLVPCP